MNSFEFKNCFFAYQLSSASGSDFDRKKCTDVNDFIDLLKMKTSYVKNEIEVYKKAKQKKDSALYTKSILEKEMINCDKKISSILKMPLASL